MLYQLAHAANLLGIVVGLLVGLVVHDAAQVLVARALGDTSDTRPSRIIAGLAARVDPFGAVAAVIAGWGWGLPVDVDERWRARRYRSSIALAAGPVSYVVLTLLALLALRLSYPDASFFPLPSGSAPFGFTVLTWIAYTTAGQAIVAILPLPPLDGGRIMLLLAPQTLGWQKARYQLVERNIGIAVALAIVLLPRLFPSLPGVIDQLAPQLIRGLGTLVGESVGA